MAPYRINPDCTAFLGAFSRTQLLTGILSLARSTKFWDELREKNPSWLAAPWVISKTSYSKESLSTLIHSYSRLKENRQYGEKELGHLLTMAAS